MAPICIAGMHRSGTSMVARALKECGVFLGPDEDLLPAAPGNRDGFWENASLVELNDEILELLGGTWSAPPPLPDGWERSPELAPLEERARKLVEPLQGSPRWGWKDPRNSLTLPFWRRVLGEVDLVVCVRHPAAVAASLAGREGMDWDDAAALCLTYARALEQIDGGGRRVIVSYEDFLESPAGQLRRLTVSLGLHPTEDEEALALETVNRPLRHDAGHAEGPLPPGLLESYERLRAEAPEIPAVEPPTPEAQLRAARALLAEIRARFYTAQNDLAESRATAVRLHGELTEVKAALDARDRKLTEADRALAAAAARAGEAERRLQAANEELEEARRLSDARARELEEIKSTRAWRVARRWWWIAAKLRPRPGR